MDVRAVEGDDDGDGLRRVRRSELRRMKEAGWGERGRGSEERERRGSEKRERERHEVRAGRGASRECRVWPDSTGGFGQIRERFRGQRWWSERRDGRGRENKEGERGGGRRGKDDDSRRQWCMTVAADGEQWWLTATADAGQWSVVELVGTSGM
ncbi:hypothetical protein Scep_029448 [Stephania cephalantha]|uniref:Uncharacterized protein n=1 Tax=Stephania cephalantha TaxID=152367 RepID=A0AAP0HFL4_9MAGN